MDKRGFGMIGAIIAMVVAGLIVYGIIYYGPDILHGIQGSSGGSGTLSPSYVRAHASLYIDNEIVVEGYWQEIYGSIGMMNDETFPVESTTGLVGTYGGTGLISGGKYRITGTLKTTPDSSTNNMLNALKLIYGISVYLEVTKVEPM